MIQNINANTNSSLFYLELIKKALKPSINANSDKEVRNQTKIIRFNLLMHVKKILDTIIFENTQFNGEMI